MISVKIKIADQYYNGGEIILEENGDVDAVINKTVKLYLVGDETNEQTLEVVPGSYVKNINKGTAKVTLRGVGEYGGIKTLSFKILPKEAKDAYKSVFEGMVDMF